MPFLTKEGKGICNEGFVLIQLFKVCFLSWKLIEESALKEAFKRAADVGLLLFIALFWKFFIVSNRRNGIGRIRRVQRGYNSNMTYTESSVIRLPFLSVKY